MSKLSPSTIDKISKLANLPLSDKEKSAYSSQLPKIVDYMDQLASVPTSDTDPTFAPVDLQNVTRKDEPLPGLSQEEALKNAPVVRNGLFVVESVNKQ